MRFRRALARLRYVSDSRYSTRTSLAPTLKFVQWSVLKLLMPHGLREGLKLCHCCCWGTSGPINALRSAALFCVGYPTSPTCLSRFLSSFVLTARGPKRLRRGLPCTPLERSDILWHASLCLLVSLQDARPSFSTAGAQPGRGCTHQAECSEAWKNCFSNSLNRKQRD